MSTENFRDTIAVEKLDLAGRNWVVFQKCLTVAVHQWKVIKHFTGEAGARPGFADPDKPTAAEKTALTSWEEKEDLVMYLLTQKLDDTTLTKHMRKGTVAEIWAAITQEFMQKSLQLHASLRLKFTTMRYTPGADLHAEFDRVRVKYEELLNMDIKISDVEYSSMLIAFLPAELSDFVSHLSSTIKATRLVHDAMKSTAANTTPSSKPTSLEDEKPDLPADVIMELALEEWDRRRSTHPKGKTTPKSDPGVAAAAISSERPKSGKGKKGPQRPVGVCWNCRGKGHKSDQCPSPKQSDDGQGKSGKWDQSKSKPTAASAVDLNTVAGAWTAFAPVSLDLSVLWIW